jgi:5'-AMP-activated protein kinase catalytic alpha subunit
MPPRPQQPGGGMQTVGHYTLLETVGQGTFGEVMLAVERHTRESVAVKILEKEKIVDEDARQRLVHEILILQRVQHPNLVQLLEVIDEPTRIYLVTEYVGGGELFSYIVQKGRLEEGEACRLFGQMVAAVDSCHRQLVIHRDLKPENVLLDANGEIKVIDFGLGTLLHYADEVLTVACGSPHYAAPEMLLGGGYLGQRADMWSLGVCL